MWFEGSIENGTTALAILAGAAGLAGSWRAKPARASPERTKTRLMAGKIIKRRKPEQLAGNDMASSLKIPPRR